MSKVVDYTLYGWPDCIRISDEFKPFSTRMNELSVESDCLIWGNRVIVPSQLRETVLQELHDAHPGMNRSKALARSFCWWPTIDYDIEKYVKDCQQCNENQANPSKAPVHPWETAKNPWTRLHLDYAGPFLGKMFLIIYDTYSKWIDAYPVTQAGSGVTITKLERTFAAHGLPLIIVTDNASCFTSAEFKEFMEKTE